MRWLFALVLMLSPAFAEAAWRHYENARYGFAIDVPGGLILANESENGDGATFASADGAAELLVWGGFLVDTNMAGEAKSRRAGEEEDGWTISYATTKRGWFAYSGTKADRIIYAKAVSSCKDAAALHFRLEYPKAEKLQYDAMVTRLSKSLKAIKGFQCS